jgi:hypothetical protein
MTETSVLMYLKFGRRLLICILKNESDSAIRMLTAKDLAQYKEAVSGKHPMLDGVWCLWMG